MHRKTQSTKKYSESKPAVLLMGEFIVVSKDDPNFQVIESPAIQTCITVKIENTKYLAVAHIDNAVNAKKVIQAIMKEMGKDDKSNYKAELIGGDVSILNQGSEPMRKLICSTLDGYNIPYTHKHFSYYFPDVILPCLYLGVRMLNLVGPESYVQTAALLGVVFFINYASNSFLSNTFDLHVNVRDGSTKVTKNNTQNSERILTLATPSQTQRFFNRMKLDPRSSSASSLEIAKHNDSMRL